MLAGLGLTAWLTLKPAALDRTAPLKGIPVHVMEYHIWWSTPFSGPQEERMWNKWNDNSSSSLGRALGPSWQRRTVSGALPLLGCYDSANHDVIRWQLRCAKAAGVAALQVQLFPNKESGAWFGREAVFATIVRIADEEGMAVYIHDEVQFRGPPSTQPEVMAARLTEALNRYGSLPGYYKIDGKPVVSFQYWTEFATPDEILAMVRAVSRALPGGVHFMLNGRYESVFDNSDSLGSFIMLSNSGQMKDRTMRDPALDWRQLETKLWKVRLARLARLFGRRPGETRFGLWAYGGFDDTKPDSPTPAWLPRGENLANLRETMRRYAAARPDFVVLSSWNDWQENSALEPALIVDGFDGDPYQALRAIASLQGKTFTPPPLPPPAAMDPWLSARHGGPDLTPPRLAEITAQPDGALRSTFVDETSPVGKIEVARAPAQSGQPDATTAHGRSGVDLHEDFPYELHPELFAKKGERIWLAVTLWDGARDSLAITYPVNPPEKRDPVDEIPVARWLTFPLRGTQRWRTMIFALDDFEMAGASPYVKFLALKSKGIILSAVSVFRESDFEAGEVAELAASADRTVVTSWLPKLPAAPHLLLSARDVNENRMLPAAIDLAGIRAGEPIPTDD